MGNSKWRTQELGIYMNIMRLNINVNGVKAPGFVGTDELFYTLAARIGTSIPQEYIDFIKEVDGGHPEIGSFCRENDIENILGDVDWFYTFSNVHIENIHTALDAWGEKIGGYSLPIGRDGGGNQIYLDLKTNPASVWLYLHDEGESRIKLANSFDEFLSGLTTNPDFI